MTDECVYKMAKQKLSLIGVYSALDAFILCRWLVVETECVCVCVLSVLAVWHCKFSSGNCIYFSCCCCCRCGRFDGNLL